jgi:hypothetical protein
MARGEFHDALPRHALTAVAGYCSSRLIRSIRLSFATQAPQGFNPDSAVGSKKKAM